MTTPSQRPKRTEEPLLALARKWWRSKYGRPASDPAFQRAIPEELVAEMLEEMWDKKEALERDLMDPTFPGDTAPLRAELASISETLGLHRHGATIVTGDKLIDHLIARHQSGEITDEDLYLEDEDLED